MTSCDTTPYRRSCSCWQYLDRFLDCCCRAPASLILPAEAPAVGDVFCICSGTLGSLILSAEVPAVCIFCCLVRGFMHGSVGSPTDLSRLTTDPCSLTISVRLISGICFFDIFLILWYSNHVNLLPSMLTQCVCIPLFVKDKF